MLLLVVLANELTLFPRNNFVNSVLGERDEDTAANGIQHLNRVIFGGRRRINEVFQLPNIMTK